MRLPSVLAASLILGGCHSGPVGAAALSVTGSALTAINQDWLAGKLPFLKINKTPAPQVQSGATSAGAR